MFISIRTSGLALRSALFGSALLLAAGFAPAASAQTAPQLLPYTAKLIAGGGTAVVGLNATCPISGFKSTDAYGDGCLATEIELGNAATGANTPGARSAAADLNGNVFFTDYVAALVRRVDAVTGIVTAVAGGGTTAAGPSSGALGTAVKLSHPAGIAFAPNGDLYFSDTGNGQVFKIAATNGFITTTGVLSLVAGSPAGTYGYAASNATTTITSANSYLRAPYGISFDTKGDLFIVDEYTEAILALNTNATGTNTVNGVAVPAGTIWKIAGTSTGATAPYCVNGTATGYGCSYGLYTENIAANTDSFDSTYSVAVDPNGVVYGGDEYYNSVFKVSSAGILSTFSGIQNKAAKPAVTTRAAAGSFGIGSIFGVASDANANIYIGDASSGLIWRVDYPSNIQYVVAGGATTVCSTSTDAYGDGCPATQATLGHSGTSLYATTTLPGPGVYGVTADTNSNIYFGDTETNLVREISSGTQFGPVGAGQPTQTLDIHFAVGDTPAASAYTIIAGAANFTLGSPTCLTPNSDKSQDCLLPVTATPSALGAFTGTLQVKSTLGATATFPLTGTYVQSPVTRTAVTYNSTGNCAGTSVFSTTTPITLSAAITANGPAPPTGTIKFFANGVQIGATQTVSNIAATGASPVYGATLSYTFSTPAVYTITATYSGDGYFATSTGAVNGTVTSSAPTFTTSVISQQESAVTAGGIALYSFNVAANVYTGTISFACSGLPANSSCSFSPATLVAAGCSSTSTVALSILTQQATPVKSSGIGAGAGRLQALSILAGLGMALLIGIRRRRAPLRYGQLWLALALLFAASGVVACGNGLSGTPATPSGTSTVTVTATGSAGTVTTFTIPLTVK